MINRRPPMSTATALAWLLKSSTPASLGVAIQSTVPVRLSKETYRWRSAERSPQPVPTTLMISWSPSTSGVCVRPPYPELRPISSPRRRSQTVFPSRSRQKR
jgi:hypothetical protein